MVLGDVKDGGCSNKVSAWSKQGTLGSETQQRGKQMKDMISQLHEWIKLVSQVGIGLIALGVIVEIVFGTGAIFGGSVIANITQIVNQIGGQNGFVGLIAILLILAIFQRSNK